MNLQTNSLLSRWALRLSVLTMLGTAVGVAQAQPTPRGQPVIRTPQTRPSAAPTAGPATPPAKPGGPAAPPANPPGPAGPTTPPAKPGGPAAPNQPGEKPDDMGLKQAPKEIDFKPAPPGATFQFNLEDADLPELVKAISGITGKRFIYGGKLRQIKVTVVCPEKVSAAEAYQAFLSILQSNGMTVIPHGRFLKIIESPGVVQEPTQVYGQATPVPNEERFMTRIYRLQHVDANEVGNVLGRFKSKDGDITVYPQGNLVILTDTGANIQRMLRIVEDVDVGGAGDQLWVEPVHYGSATEVANKLNDILDLKGKAGGAGGAAGGKGGGGGPAGARIIPDDRTNSLIITSSQPDYVRLLELIKRMDVPRSGEGDIHVLPLQHAGCKELAQTLNQILGVGSTGSFGAAGATGARPGGAPTTPGTTAPGTAAGPGGRNPLLEDIFEGPVRVTCDEATNSLVVTSSARDYAQMRGVIDKLDMARRQVYIEAVIMDVSIDHSLDLGIGYHAGTAFDVGGDQAIFYGGNNPGQSVLGVPAHLEALALGLRGPPIAGSENIFGTGISIPAFGVVMHALAQDGDSNVLATPHILATDNVKATISIGQNIPLQTNVGGLGSLAGLAGGAGGQAAGGAAALAGLGGLGLLGGLGQAQRADVGTKIDVTPHVNDSDQVRLELSEEISEAGSPLGALGAIPINKRTANTTLVVRDQQTVVIGGLIRDSVINAQTKIPVLGDIPVLGFLFRQSTKKVQKSNLLLILTPYVIRDQDDLRAIFERKMQERQEFLDRYFVFAENKPWEPPHDFSRTNGLVEDIRQSILAQEERERLEAEARPKGPFSHEPGEPITLPNLGGGRGGAAGSIGPAPAGGPAAAPAEAPEAPAGGRPRVRVPANPGGGATPRPERVE